MNQAKALYDLQEIDLAIQQREKRLQAIADQLANDEAVQAAQQQVTSAEVTLQPLRTRMRDLELQLQTTREKRDTTEKRLYSGTVSNPKELQDMQQEIESLKKWDAELEDRMLEVMVQVDDAESILEESQTTLETVLQEAAAENQDLLAEKQTLEADIVDFRTKRETAVTKVDAVNLKLYDEMRPQKGNQPIARMSEDATCSACGIRQMGVAAKDVRRSDELVTCKNCKRILAAF